MTSVAAFSILPASRRTVLRFAHDGERLAEIELEGDRPAWLVPTIERLRELLELPENWDSYGGRPIDPAAVAWALRLLGKVMHSDSPSPTIIPTTEGGIELEWHLGGIDLEVHPLPTGGVYVYFEDQQSAEQWETEVGSDLSPLSEALSELSRRA